MFSFFGSDGGATSPTGALHLDDRGEQGQDH